MSRALLLALSLLLLLPTMGAADDEKIFSYSDNGYANLDPANASLYRINDERLIVAMQECLTTLDPENGKARAGAATGWTLAADGRTWKFTLRKDAKWSDGSPVTSEDFVRAWRRVMDPFTKSPWSWLYRPIKGCGAIRDNSAMTDGLSELRRAVKELLAGNPNGIPGSSLNLALDDTGVRPFLVDIKSRSVKRLLDWKDGDIFPPESAEKVIEELKKERRKANDVWEEVLGSLGKSGSGVHAPDAHTLVVVTEGEVPYLPELVARAAFAPLHASVDSLRAGAFEVGGYVNNGPYLLKGRGAKPPEGKEGERVMSVVELARNPHYNGPNGAKVDRIMCSTDLSIHITAQEDLFQFERGKLQWVNVTWPEWPKDKLRKQMEGMKGFTVRETPRVLYLRFRCDRAPFNEKEARKAFALSIDRDACAARLWPKAVPAYRLVPTGIEGRVDGIACPNTNEAGAKAAFQLAKLNADTWIETGYGEAPGQDEVARVLNTAWKKALGVDPGLVIQPDTDVRSVVRAGKYYVMLTDFRGAVNDPGAYLEPLHSKDADSGLGWYDAAYDALIDAARDSTVATSDPDGWIKTVGDPSLRSAVDAAKGSVEGRLRLRREALAAAEKRLMDEFVVVPILFLKEATLLGDARGLGEDLARRNPGFVGSLVSVER
ncbi:MAG: ABC transporter substrate-binding protein [Planctomycetota bacterium]|nr:ABC transporter substrate-binding protein [Planctomycetota bacterium]